MHYYQRNLGDYAKDTGTLTQADHGAYGLLTDHYYSTEKPLPLDPDDLYAIGKAGTAAEKKAVDRVLAKFFKREADGYHHKRINAEIARYKTKSVLASDSALERWDQQSERDADALQSHMRTHSGRKPKRSAKADADAMLTSNQEPTSPSLRSGETRAKRRKTEMATLIPPDFCISPDVRAWASRKGFESYLELHLEHFIDYAKGGNGAGKPVYALDWEAKFRNCVRADWGDVRMKAQRSARANGGSKSTAWRVGAEPNDVLSRVAAQMQIEPWDQEGGETHGQFRARIVAAGGEPLLSPRKAA